MRRYVNTRTGAVIETASLCSGEDWEEVVTKTAAETQRKKATDKKTAAKTQRKKEVKSHE